MVQPPLAFLLLLTAFAACAETNLRVENAWIREAPPVAKVLAAYMVIHNNSTKTRTLGTFTSADFKRIELHRTVLADGVARMSPQPRLTLTGHQQLVLEPGGYHLMLFNPTRTLRANDRVSITMHYNEQTTTFPLVVKKTTRAQPHRHH